MTEEHNFVEIFYNFESALNFTLDWIEENLEEDQYIDRQEIILMDSGAYRAGVLLKNKQIDFDTLFGASEDA